MDVSVAADEELLEISLVAAFCCWTAALTFAVISSRREIALPIEVLLVTARLVSS